MAPLHPHLLNRVKLFTADDRPAPFNLQVADLQLPRLPGRAQPTPVTWPLTGGMVLVLIGAATGHRAPPGGASPKMWGVESSPRQMLRETLTWGHNR